MVTVVRAEAVLTAQNKLRPGLVNAANELNRFRAMQTKATAAFSSSAARAMAVTQNRLAAAQSRIIAAGRSQLITLGGPAALGASYKQFADVDRQITNIGITAGASAEELAGVRKQIEGIAYETAQPSGKVTGGLEVLVAQGRNVKESLNFLPSIARTAAVTNSEMADIAKSSDAVASNFKIASKDMQAAFDIMAAGGNAGTFELKDMSRYLPSLAPAASAIGFSGQKGLADLVSILQIIRKGSGTSEEAYSSMNNVLMKMDSDETRKNFKKFGIDSAKALEQTRKSGGNVIETFEQLIRTATKGDNAKIGEIVKDAEFKRGVLALRTYEGEWQKLSKTIQSTAPGTVARDLTKVTTDARAQIDRMFSAIENRAVQVGGVLAKYVVLPAEAAIKRIEEGQNPAVNRINEWASHYVNDIIAKSELKGGTVHTYDEASRVRINARKDFLTPQRIEEERSRLRGEIENLGTKRKSILDAAVAGNEILPPHLAEANSARASGETGPLDNQLAAAQARLDDLNALVSRVDDLNLKLAEVQGAAATAAKPRMTLPIGEVKTEIEALGQAGQSAGSQLADGFSLGMSRLENEAVAVIARVQQRLNSLRAPSLSFGGVSGMNTGRQGAE